MCYRPNLSGRKLDMKMPVNKALLEMAAVVGLPQEEVDDFAESGRSEDDEVDRHVTRQEIDARRGNREFRSGIRNL